MIHNDYGPRAGGETTEFPGGPTPQAAPCTKVASRVERPLSDPEVSAWTAALDGQHQLSLGWREQAFGASGFEPETTISLELRTVNAHTIRWEEGTCDDTRTLHLTVEVSFAVADGSLAGNLDAIVAAIPGSVPHEAATLVTPWEQWADLTPLLRGLDLGQGDLSGRHADLVFDFALIDGQLRGAFDLWVEGKDTEDGAMTPVLSAGFPDDGCPANAKPLSLDTPLESQGGATGQALLEPVAAMLSEAPYPARWRDPATGSSLAATEVSFAVQAGPWVCMQPGRSAWAPISVALATQDGRLDFAYPGALTLHGQAEGGKYKLTLHSPWMPSGDLPTRIGIDDAALRPGDFARVALDAALDLERQTMEGRLVLERLRNSDRQPTDHPQLVWPDG